MPLTCPFSHAELEVRHDRPINKATFLREEPAARAYAIECVGCGARGPWASDCIEAIALWNNLSSSREKST